MKPGALDYRELDELIHSRLRLCVMLLLAGGEEVDFTTIRNALATTDGNLITHLRKLEEVGYIRARRERRLTNYRLTPLGRRKLRRYRRTLMDMLAIGED